MENNPYQSPAQLTEHVSDKPAPHLLANTASMFFRHSLLLAFVAFLLMYVIPAFDKLFVEFELMLPTNSRYVFAISHFAVNYWYLAIPAAPLYFLFLMQVKKSGRRTARLDLVWPLVFWLGGLIFLFMIVVAIMVPFNSLRAGLSK